jgi:ribosome biogenesis protein Nip4
MLEKFVNQFTDHSIRYVKILDMFFLENTQLEKYQLSWEPTLYGLYLGKSDCSEFIPSFNLLDIIARDSDEKVFVNEFGELDFLHGKNLRKRHITSIQGSLKRGTKKLVQNKYDENLGYGVYLGEEKHSTKILTHVTDRGVFIKRDKRLKK